MTQNIRQALKKRIEASRWMNEQTKERALHKLEKMKLLIGYPDD